MLKKAIIGALLLLAISAGADSVDAQSQDAPDGDTAAIELRVWQHVRDAERIGKTLDVFARDDNFDMIVVEFGAGAVKQDANALDERIEVLQQVREQQPGTPIVTVLSTDIPYVEGVDTQAVAKKFFEAGLPCFASMERGAAALRKARDFQRRSTWLLPDGA